MTITLGTYILASDGDMGPQNLRLTAVRQAEEVEYIRATEGEVFDRGNQLISLSFTVQREHETLGECENFILDEPNTAPNKARLIIVSTGGENRRMVDGMMLTQIDIQQIGVTSFHTYSLKGPPPKKVKVVTT